MKPKTAVLACLLLASSMTAIAQWQWIDAGGRKVFSDRAPPPDIPEKSILKQPGSRATTAAAATVPTPQASAPGATASAVAPRISGKDKVLEEKKKQVEKAEADQLKAQEEKNLKIKAENCSRAKTAKATLDSGSRLARMNEKGEREFLDDTARAAETKRAQEIIQSECK